MTDWDKWGRRELGPPENRWTEYKLHPTVAKLIKELRCGLNGNGKHSWRAIAIKIVGFECQMTGKDLCRIAKWTLGEEHLEWDLE
jgi:hypothetical protein